MAFSKVFVAQEPPREEVDTWEAPTVIEFGTPWCGHCLAAQPLIAAAFEEYPNVLHIKVEDGRGRPLGRSFRVKLWPTLIFLRQGQEIERLVRPGDSQTISQALAKIANEP
ncbi:thioredoxin family protein [Halomonas sp. WWR20]